ncbi:DUF5786 family protein [Halorussus halobius]|uniref:DUF5786 family protein n=1 Tax=Halorussus halobius TaxID=1710537 RepID=UPI001091E821|nr:DUF5786 family protein [Halorussus halobius]
MGFGSYDESEQQDQDNDFDEDDGVTVHENTHEGKVSFDSDASQDELLDQLNDIKDSDDES